MSIYHMEAAYSIQHMEDSPISINVITTGTSSIWDCTSSRIV